MICSCCGYEIVGKSHAVENGKRSVCDKCWNNPDLFFPERLEKDDRLRLLSEMASKNQELSQFVSISVIKLSQKNLELYIGKMKSRDILQLYEIDKFKEEELEGYQREQYEDRTSELIEYLVKCPVAVMPSLFVSLRKARFVRENGDFGTLEIPRNRGSIWIIDGQHRVGGFEKVYQRFAFARNPGDIDSDAFSKLMDYELPVVFIDTRKAAEAMRDSKNGENREITPEDLERVIFFIVNKTQKGISPSLKDALLYKIKIGGIEGIPAIRKEKWRIRAAHVGISLNREIDSPLIGMINVGGKAGTGKPIQLNSFISSLEPLFANEYFSKLDDEERVKFIKSYWNALKKAVPQAFDLKEWKEYMLFKAIGMYCLNWLALDIFKACTESGLRCDDDQSMGKLVEPISGFDWRRQTSPLSALGGLKGARQGYEKLRMYLNSATTT